MGQADAFRALPDKPMSTQAATRVAHLPHRSRTRWMDPRAPEIIPAPELVEAIAQRVVELLREELTDDRAVRLIDAAALARELGVERDWVYEHAERLGAIRLGGPKGRMRFDREAVLDRLGPESIQGKGAGRAPGRGKPAAAARRQRKARPGGRRELKSPQKQRRAGGSAPARSPKRHHTGGNPE